MTNQPLWSVPIHIDHVPESGRSLDFAADAATREAVARAADVVAIPRIEGRFQLDRHGAEGMHVHGMVTATVEQTCVVTLEPLINEVAEPVDLYFDTAAKDVPLRGKDDLAPADEPEPPEPLTDGTIDLGAIAVDFLLLGIDPYPRKPGATFSQPRSLKEDEEHPFAALAALRNGWSEKG